MREKSTEKALQAHLAHLQSGDLLEAAHQARQQGMARLEDQGIAALALFISELLVETLEQASPPAKTSSA